MAANSRAWLRPAGAGAKGEPADHQAHREGAGDIDEGDPVGKLVADRAGGRHCDRMAQDAAETGAEKDEEDGLHGLL